jgi:hypothetical protein
MIKDTKNTNKKAQPKQPRHKLKKHDQNNEKHQHKSVTKIRKTLVEEHNQGNKEHEQKNSTKLMKSTSTRT